MDLYVRWLLLLASVVGYRVWFPDSPPLSRIGVDYDLVVIALVGLYRGQRIGAGAGWVIGFLCYSLDPDHMAWGGFLGAILGWLVGHWRERLFLEQLGYRWLVFGTAITGYKILHYVLIVGHDWPGLPKLFAVLLLPTALIDATLAVLIGVVWERARSTGRSSLDGASVDKTV